MIFNIFTSRYKARLFAESSGITDYVIVKHGEIYQLYINLDMVLEGLHELQEISKKSK